MKTARQRIEYIVQWQRDNRERANANRRRWVKRHASQNAACKRSYRLRNRAKILEKMKLYNAANKIKRRVYGRRYRLEHVDAYRAASRRWFASPKGRATMSAYRKRKKRTDFGYMISARVRSRMRSAFIRHRVRKSNRTLVLIGCTFEVLKAHIESLFKPGMMWENRGMWHIDHIQPCASFDLTDSEQQRRCFHYTNLQPLWADENQKKGAKVPA